ncbi:hypothetical protein D1AOALGA4SA_6222 [Olavius algarvensis Delta 1 endosymbiont]|nr:hypothetical protein D1AOALGA4SA_6222 [Olavius algarvensis Delta 1 endosymbiont]
MYDAVLITTHYGYGRDGTMQPPQDSADHEDLSAVIPLGIIHVAQYLHDSGYNVRVVHIPHLMASMKRFGLNEDQLDKSIEKILQKFPAHVCGIQTHFYLYSGGAVYISNAYKKLFPDSKIFLGGYMATACWQQFLAASPNIDGVILGEGEKTFRIVLEKSLVSQPVDFNNVAGLAFRSSNGNFICNAPAAGCSLPLAEIPVIRPDAPPFENIAWQKRHYINISRGRCPEQCAYCVGNNKVINARKYQTVTIDKILEQVRIYQDFGMRGLFLGETHFINTSFMKELIENIIDENLDLYFELETHPVIFENTRLLDKMIEAKFLRYTMGCESGSNSLLQRMGRNSDARQILGSVKQIAARGAMAVTSWVSNLPGETAVEFGETQELMRRVVKAGGFIYWIENLHVLPGSRISQQPENYDIEILLNNLKDWIRWSIDSKKYVDFQDALNEPLKYLTHLNRNSSAPDMIERFYSNRSLARALIPAMKLNLADRLKSLAPDLYESEMQTLDWYERKGWRLWLF